MALVYALFKIKTGLRKWSKGMRRTFSCICVITLWWCFSNTAYTKPSDEMGLVIAMQVEKRDSGWGDMSANVTMTLRGKGAGEKRVIFSLQLLESEDGNQSLIVIKSPNELKGVALLTQGNLIEFSEQWTVTPGSNAQPVFFSEKANSFLGGELSYEDLSLSGVDQYRHEYKYDEELNGQTAFVVERFPLYDDSAYSRLMVWIDKTMYQPVKIEYYDRANKLFKTHYYQRYRQYLERHWRPGSIEMHNHQTGHVTVLEFNDIRFKQGLSKEIFLIQDE